jgi:hypothetical protein
MKTPIQAIIVAAIVVVSIVMIPVYIVGITNDRQAQWLVETNCTPTSMYTPATVNYPPQRIYDCEGAEMRVEE